MSLWVCTTSLGKPHRRKTCFYCVSVQGSLPLASFYYAISFHCRTTYFHACRMIEKPVKPGSRDLEGNIRHLARQIHTRPLCPPTFLSFSKYCLIRGWHECSAPCFISAVSCRFRYGRKLDSIMPLIVANNGWSHSTAQPSRCRVHLI